eukprot:symbB.v1.2.034812.t1/scaffold4559.1/size42167/1
MLQVNVALPNGDAELLSLLPSSTVQDLRTAAQRAFGRKCLRLITAKSRVLVDPNKTLEAAEIEDGECLTALLLQPQLAATKTAFALWCHGDSAIVTWGSARSGGDSSAVRDQLRGVQQIQATWGAFAAILEDGSVVTWGGGSLPVRHLRGLKQIQNTEAAFAAILEDGSAFTWGAAYAGGDSMAVQDQLRGVQQIQATWGAPPPASCTSTCSAPPGPCADKSTGGVQQIQATNCGAFAAILEDGSVITWGEADCGGDSSAVGNQLRGVQQIQATSYAFAAILEDGSVITWGEQRRGGDSSAVRDQLRGVQQIQATDYAFSAILADGSVVTWGDAACGGDSSAVRDQLRGVQQIQGTANAFAAILADGSVVTWGHAETGGDRDADPSTLLIERIDTGIGSLLTQGVMSAMLMTVAASKMYAKQDIETVDQLLDIFTHTLGGALRAKIALTFAICGACIVAAIVVSLCGSWALEEAMGREIGLSTGEERTNCSNMMRRIASNLKQRPIFYAAFIATCAIAWVLTIFTPKFSVELTGVWTQFINGLLMPPTIFSLWYLASYKLNDEYRLGPFMKWLQFLLFGICSAFCLISIPFAIEDSLESKS